MIAYIEGKKQEFIVFSVHPLQKTGYIFLRMRKNAEWYDYFRQNELAEGFQDFKSKKVISHFLQKINKLAVEPLKFTRWWKTPATQAADYIIIVPLRWYDGKLYSSLHSGISLTYFSEHSQIQLQFQLTLTNWDPDRYYNQAKRGWSIINVVPHVRIADLFLVIGLTCNLAERIIISLTS